MPTQFSPLPSTSLHDGECVRLSAVISSLSHALDITEGQPVGHAIRSCVIGMRMAEALRLSSADRAALFYALLLKDLGCSSNAAKMCWLFKADDRLVKRDVKLVNWRSFLSNLRFGLSHVLPGGSLGSRLKALLGLSKCGVNTTKELIQTRCERGADIVRMLGFPEATAQAILGLDEHWDGAGHPLNLRGEEISLLGRICCLAQTVEVFVTNHDVDTAVGVARRRRGSWFDPELVDVVSALRRDRGLWNLLRSPRVGERMRELEPEDHVRFADAKLLDEIALGFSQVVDAKSPWTYRHSEGVADLAVEMAEVLGWSAAEIRNLRRAGLLHDIGKLGVSNLILDKPGKLTDDEFAQMRRHVQYTYEILHHVPQFANMAGVAAAHHERLDGRGYLLGLQGDAIPREARLLAVADVCEALSAKRPYRDPMPTERILEILRKDSGSAFFPEAVEAMLTVESQNDAITKIQSRVGDLHERMHAIQSIAG